MAHDQLTAKYILKSWLTSARVPQRLVLAMDDRLGERRACDSHMIYRSTLHMDAALAASARKIAWYAFHDSQIVNQIVESLATRLSDSHLNRSEAWYVLTCH